MNRKGTEKPIEIFVALFIILAVALVMLKLFQSQIADKQKELADVQQEQKSKEMLQKVKQACSDKCVDASNNGCSDASLAALCTYGSRQVLANGYIDLNNDQDNGYDETLLAGVGVCEDRIYCFHLVDSCCARAINAASCKEILTNYWQDQKFSADEITSMTNTDNTDGILYAGTCGKSAGTRWDELKSWTGAE